MKQATNRAGDWLSDLDAKGVIVRAPLSNGRQITFRQFGKGAPLVLLHGGHGNWKHWAANIESLAGQFEVWVPDLPGYGDSDDLASDSGFEAVVEQLNTALDGLFGVTTEIGLAGFSFGGLVAATLAGHRPVRRLALLGSAGHGGPRREYGPMLNWRATQTQEERRRALHHNLAAFMLFDASKIDATALDIYEDACVRTRFRSKALALNGNLAKALAYVDSPTLLVWGGEDATAAHPERFMDALSDRSRCRFETIPDAGHWVQWESAGQINDMFCRWFER